MQTSLLTARNKCVLQHLESSTSSDGTSSFERAAILRAYLGTVAMGASCHDRSTIVPELIAERGYFGYLAFNRNSE